MKHPTIHDEHLQISHYDRMIRRTRSQLPRRYRILSRIVHTSAIETVLNMMLRIIPPRALIGASITPLATALIVYYVVERYGYTFNYFLPLVAVVVGGLAGYIYSAFKR